MKRGRVFLLIGTGMLAAGAALVSGATEPDTRYAATEPVDIGSGATLYGEYCAACHGADLEGQENWRSPGNDGRLPAPPHNETGHTWHHADSVLIAYTRLGGREMMASKGIEFDSAMPGFGDQLSDQEIWNILGYIKSRWPDRIRSVQAERTADDNQNRE